MKTIEEVQIPLVVLPPPDICQLVAWRVPDGSHVTVGEVIFDIEVRGAVYEIESFDTGYIKIGASAGSEHKVGDCIASIACEGVREGHTMIGVELCHAQIACLDALRGDIPRREFLWKFVRDALERTDIGSEQAGASDGDKPVV